VQTVELLSRDGDDVALGAAAPDFELAVLGGGTVRLSDQEGVPVVLVYFATW
jgi:peroxiredoxin